MYDIVGKRNWYFAFSALLTIPGLIFILLGGLKPSVDFTGGTVWEVRFASQPAPDEVEAALVDLGYPETQVRSSSEGYLEIRTEPLDLIPPGGPGGRVGAGFGVTGASSSACPAMGTASPVVV